MLRGLGLVTICLMTDPVFQITSIDTYDAYLAAVDTAQQAADSYYHGDGSTLDDATYDALLRGIASVEAAHPDWVVSHDIFTAVAAGTTAKADVPHAAPMLSLDNVFSSIELAEWCANRSRVAAGTISGYTVEPKFDGLSLAVTYQNGRLVRLATRGNGNAGEDVTYAAGRLHNLPMTLPEDISLEVRGEVLFTRVGYNEANTARIAFGKNPYVNARNAAAGALRAETLDYPVSLVFFAHGQVGLDVRSQSEAFAKLAALGIPVGASELPAVQASDSAEVVSAVETILAARPTLLFEIDGAVVKVDSTSEQTNLGFSSRAPRWGIAVKFPAEEVYGTVSAIEVQVGRLGTITPVAKLHPPVFVGGTNVSSITLHNFDDLAKRDVRIGDTVVVRRAGDVIPEIAAVRLENRPAEREPYTPPADCPRCGAEIDRSQVRWRCSRGRACGLVESLTYATGRDQLDIEGCGEKVVAQLVAAQLVEDVADLFSLTREQLIGLDRFGATSADKLIAQINAAKTRPLSRVFTALGVRMTGRSMSRRLARHFRTMDAIQKASIEQLAEVEGVGPERAMSIAMELMEIAPVISKLEAAGVNLNENEFSVMPSGDLPLAGKSVVVTGNLGALTRTQAQEAVESLGGKPTGSVSKKTDLVIVGDAPGASKVSKAEEFSIPTMTGEEFLALLKSI
jgi:DNA ligase (NAD+)